MGGGAVINFTPDYGSMSRHVLFGDKKIEYATIDENKRVFKGVRKHFRKALDKGVWEV